MQICHMDTSCIQWTQWTVEMLHVAVSFASLIVIMLSLSLSESNQHVITSSAASTVKARGGVMPANGLN